MEVMKSIWSKRYVYAQRIALVATPLSVLGFVNILGNTGGRIPVIWSLMFLLGLTLTAVAYLLGGFWTAVKSAGKIAKWGWLVIPFPYDIVTGIAAFFVGLLVFLLVPIIPIRKAYREHANSRG